MYTSSIKVKNLIELQLSQNGRFVVKRNKIWEAYCMRQRILKHRYQIRIAYNVVKTKHW